MKSNDIEIFVNSLRNDAYVIIEEAVSDSCIKSIFAETLSPEVRVNPNALGSAFHGTTQFYTNIIASSKVVHDIIVSPLVLDICKAYFGGSFELVNNRIQTTRGIISMPWHTDNNLLDKGKLVGRHDMPGLQFVLYLTDITASPFQLIKNSHAWSLKYENQYLSDEDIKDLNHEVIELTPKPGSLMILNTHLFHRAAPLSEDTNVRSILLFQVDKLSPDYPEHGERLLVNTEFLTEVNSLVSTFLGFGRKRRNPPFPSSSIDSLSLSKLCSLQFSLLRAFPKVFLKRALKKILPSNYVFNFKNAVVANRTNLLKNQTNNSSNPYLND